MGRWNKDGFMKQPLKILSFIFILAFLSSSLHAQELVTVIIGKRATKYVSSLVKPGDKVTKEFDVQQMDRYEKFYVKIGARHV